MSDSEGNGARESAAGGYSPDGRRHLTSGVCPSRRAGEATAGVAGSDGERGAADTGWNAAQPSCGMAREGGKRTIIGGSPKVIYGGTPRDDVRHLPLLLASAHIYVAVRSPPTRTPRVSLHPLGPISPPFGSRCLQMLTLAAFHDAGLQHLTCCSPICCGRRSARSTMADAARDRGKGFFRPAFPPCPASFERFVCAFGCACNVQYQCLCFYLIYMHL